MGFTCTQFTGESGEKFNCCQRPGQVVNSYKDCAYMPKEQTLFEFKNNIQCKNTCEALTKHSADETKIFSCKGTIEIFGYLTRGDRESNGFWY